jgi:hypothetical protein
MPHDTGKRPDPTPKTERHLFLSPFGFLLLVQAHFAVEPFDLHGDTDTRDGKEGNVRLSTQQEQQKREGAVFYNYLI